MKLTNDQNAIITSLNSWYKTEDKAISLQALAGSGKTTTLSVYAEFMLSIGVAITVIAPTHAALGQLVLRLPSEGITFMTVAKALGQFPVQSNASTEIAFGSFGGKPIEGLTIVDESSMLSEGDVNRLINICEKVIFSGDNNQLAPVKKKSGNTVLQALPQLTLTKMMRAESNAILEAGLATLKTTQYIPETSEDGSVICHENEELFKAAFIERVVAEPVGDCVFITYTNAEVREMNAAAHFKITGRTTLEVGDVVRLYSSSKLGKNNCLIKIATLEVSMSGNYIVTSEPKDGTYFKVEVALPTQYEIIEHKIERIVNEFKNNAGSDALADELEVLRSIVPIDWPYAISTHKSQGASIKIVFANSQRLHGKKSFYVAYSRASQQLNVVQKITNTKGVRVEGTVWKNKKNGVQVIVEDVFNLQSVRDAISEISSETKDVPSVSHLACVLNPAHASKSAKGWTLA